MSDPIPCQRHLFDIPPGVTYLNCAYMAPQMVEVTRVGREAVAHKGRPWTIGPDDFFDASDRARRLFAQLLGGVEADVALLPSVSYGLAVAARALGVGPADRVVVLAEQFPSNVYAWRACGAEIVTTPKPAEGRSWTEGVLAEIGRGATVVAIPVVHWTDGAALDPEVVAAKARDVGAAVDHLRTLADSYQLDLERVVVAGHSAGGHLALWLAERHRVDDPSIAGPDPLRVAGAVSLAGVDDLRRALAEGVCGQVAAQLVGGTPDEHPERYALASPAERLPATVPQHLVNGSLDTIVPDTFGRAYAEKATAARSPVGLTLLPDAGHFEVVAPEADEWAIVRDVVLGMLP